MAIINIQAVIACGSSIDIYPSFDPAQVIVCPYVLVEKDKIQLIYMNISFEDDNQIMIYLNPEIISSPKVFIKVNNNSFISPLNLSRTYTYYLSFSPELICRHSFINNETICFYYSASSNFINIEYHYDEIEHGSLILSDKSRNRFYIIFIIITILIIIICIIAIYIVCTSGISLRHTTRLDLIIDTQVARQEAAKKSRDPPEDGGGQQILAEQLVAREANTITGDV